MSSRVDGGDSPRPADHAPITPRASDTSREVALADIQRTRSGDNSSRGKGGESPVVYIPTDGNERGGVVNEKVVADIDNSGQQQPAERSGAVEGW